MTNHNFFKPGDKIQINNEDFEILDIIDLENILVKNLCTKEKRIISIAQLNSEKTNETELDLRAISDKDWNIAKKRYEAIKPILDDDNLKTPALYLEQAKIINVHYATLYRWKMRFLKSRKITSLIPFKKGHPENVNKLNSEIENIIVETIDNFYLKEQKPSIVKTWEEICIQCSTKGLKPPHINTLRNRINLISDYKRLKFREGKKTADEEYQPKIGELKTDHILQIVQIDHTPLDIILVDNETRMPLGRPYLTLAFDVYSRMALGFYISFDPVGSLSVGLCLARALLKKDQFISKLGIDVDWPCWGIPQCVHMDNGKEFRGDMLKLACEKYGIEMQWRPVATPNWGGHIERYIGTLNEMTHSLPGTTFSNPTEKGDYDSDKQAIFTIEEFERYFTTWICKVYHQRIHSSLGKTPLQVWKESILGNDKQPGRGLPKPIQDEEKLKLDFLPYELRTVNEYGILIDGIHYYSDILRPYINSKEPGKYKIRKKYIFRRDPRDISQLYFWNPDLQAYYVIPYRDTSRPAISLWELKAAEKRLKENNHNVIDEASIFKSFSELKDIVTRAKKETKKIRREKERTRLHKNAHEFKKRNVYKETEGFTAPEEDFSHIKAFDEIEIQ